MGRLNSNTAYFKLKAVKFAEYGNRAASEVCIDYKW
jgi:hypothetical protein